VHSIDPMPGPKFDPANLAKRYENRFIFHPKMSLEGLLEVNGINVVLIDGDHNWYTVYHELKLLEQLAAEQTSPFPVTFVHDIDWPYGRRDLYYNPSSIPDEYRQPFRQAGITLGQSELVDGGGFHAEGHNATIEHGPRNGVRTAVEDFLKNTPLRIRFETVAGFHGLGILVAQEDLEQKEDLRGMLDRLESPRWLRQQCHRIEQSRLWTMIRLAEVSRSASKAR
jgi:hypothetical protein